MAKSKKHKNEMNESAVEYGREIIFFNSFKEQEDFNNALILNQSYPDRIKETVDLIIKVYGYTRETLSKRKTDNHIIFSSLK